MAFALAMFAASLAWGEETVPDAAPAPAFEPLPVSSTLHYRNGMRLATTGLVLVPVGLAVAGTGLSLADHAQNDRQFSTGVLVFLAGGATAIVGPPLTIVGSLTSAVALHKAGIRVTTVWAIASSAFYVGALVFPPAYFGAVAMGGVQMAADTHALRHSGRKLHREWVILPSTVDDRHGLALVGSF